jgi:Cdc6-like AAA superfamily ATPase
LGYDIPWKGYNEEEKTLTYVLSFFELEIPGKILVLILDKFDSLMENQYNKLISDLINYIKPLNKDLSKYRLIIAGDKELIDIYSDETINRFLGSAVPIHVKDVSDEETIRSAIIEPAKNQLTYDEDAIVEIIRLCGKNLLIQQLICFYIFNYLIKEKRNHCTINDVAPAIQQILKERIPQLVQIWENRISLKTRLFASALADESFIEKRGNLYYLKESLLDDIYGKKLEEEIDKLEESGYFKEMEERQFAGAPFRIPLFGKWVQKKHPFMKTIIENIEDIADKIDLKRLIEEIEKTPAIKLTPFKKTTMLTLAKEWCLLTGSILKKGINKAARENHIHNFFETFSQTLHLNLRERTKTDQNYFVMDIKRLNIGILEKVFCFIQDRPELTEKYIRSIENTAERMVGKNKTKVIVFFYVQESDRIEKLVKESRMNLITIEENELKKIVFSKWPDEILKKIILGKLPPHRVSPFQMKRPEKITFYGHSEAIDRITGSVNKSFAVVGARKIGKTSLLNWIYDNPPPKNIYIFMDLDPVFFNTKTYGPFCRNLESEIKRIFKKKKVFGILPLGKKLSKLPGIIQKLSQEKKNIVFIFDGVDKFIQFDRKKDYKLLQLFRTMSRENCCQFIFAGFKELYRLKQINETTICDFYEEIMLTPLDKAAARDLIIKPTESIGIHFKSKKDVEFILDYTGCHPNLLQFCGKHLLEIVGKKDDLEGRRTISKEDIKQLFESRVFEEYIMNEIYDFYTGLSNINRLILMLLVEPQSKSKKNTFSSNEIKEMLNQQDIRMSAQDIHRHLKDLVMFFILKDKGRDNYSFALPVFPGILKKRVDHNFKNRIIHEIKKGII